ncbi:MAG: GNAT family N-acetyltransferase, partial [Gemmatimonadetes bacterium]|nr:GNAT family N-acetyltransferase [Gemmatimonadota bacterium]
MELTIRPVRPGDAEPWHRMRCALYGEPAPERAEIDAWFRDRPDGICLVAEDARGALVGFCEAGTRSYAEGCLSTPVGYVEGIWTEPDVRRHGVAARLLEAAEAWARSRGLVEMASDCTPDNAASLGFHRDRGFQEVEHIVCLRKTLVPEA